MKYTVEYELEADGRWLADVLEMPGAMAYGKTRDEALAKAEAITLRVMAEGLEYGEKPAEEMIITFKAA